MNANSYQEAAHEFASYGDKMYPYLGLAEEAGEVCGKAAKFIRHTHGLSPHCELEYALKKEKDKYRDDIRSELSDVLWMVAEIATLNGLTLEGIMDHSIDKLRKRKQLGVIDGSGDTDEERIMNK